PAACCGLVGLKPSRGRLVDGEQARTMPINLIGEGVVTRSVRDSAAFFYAAERYWRNPRLPALPVGAGFVRDFTLYWGLLSYSVSRFGRRMLGPGFDPAKLDGFSRGLRELFGRRRLSVPSTLYRLSRVRRSYAASFARHDLVLSPVLAHVTPKLGYLSPTVPFDELLERLIGYVAFTPLNNVSGGPAISLPVGAADNGLPIGVQFSARHGDERTLLEIGYELEQALPWRRIQDRAPAPR
ncbi:MAG: amidase family protein, partial [Micromonosporaceae bacterium]